LSWKSWRDERQIRRQGLLDDLWRDFGETDLADWCQVREVVKEEVLICNIAATLLRFVARFEGEKGQTLAEYGLILALIAIVSIAALGILGLALAGQLDAITAALP